MKFTNFSFWYVEYVLVWSYLVMSNHTVTVCDFSPETCDSRMVMVCNLFIEAYMIEVAYEILLIFWGYYYFSFLMNRVCWRCSVMINHTGTGCYFIISIFPYETWIFSCEILQGASTFFKWNSFQQNLSKDYSFKIFDLTSIFTVFICWDFSCEH